MTSAPDSPSTDALQLDNQLCFALYSTALQMEKAYQPHLKALGLTFPQYLVLLVLWEHGALTVSDIGKHLLLDSGTLTPMLKRMEAHGLVMRERDATDERRVIVTLTAKGDEMRVHATAIRMCILQATGCTTQQAKDLTQRIQRVREHLLTAA